MTRMWMCDPRILCKNHLLGEHNELHKALGGLRRGRHVRGYVERGQLEVRSMEVRHGALVAEMRRRGWTGHKTPLTIADDDLAHLTDAERDGVVDRDAALLDLIDRCDEYYMRNKHEQLSRGVYLNPEEMARRKRDRLNDSRK